ncbi:ABC transporter permease [Fulvivirgaceae bacterium BMA10]|uniref:ABC transporter permease n=1 Tax=Splendidivirga corallicola TaxID=3051826 RepID=A0ABT8KGE1_9BACT|nr:ABC transporter permease [Fulvivirgaceae bacterium BMA10]
MKKSTHNTSIEPSKLARRFLHWYCKASLLEEIEGDINESFYERIEIMGIKKARLFYTLEVISFFRPFAIRGQNLKYHNNTAMLRNYFKVSFRNILTDKLHTSINIIGLTIALICSIVIYMVVRHEITYDTFHTNADRIFRITHDESELNPNSNRHLSTVGPPVGPAIKAFYPQVENSVRFRYTPTQIMARGKERFYEENIFYVDSTIFNVFSYKLALGNPKTALKEPGSVILTHEMALKYFGDENPLNQTIFMNNDTELLVTGVLEPIPSNTHFKFDFLLPFHAFKVPFGYPVTLDDWGWISFHTYVMLSHDIDPKVLEAELPNFIDAHWPNEQRRFKFRLQPLTDIYFGEVKNDIIASGNRVYVYGLAVTGLLIILLAAFNFTNLSTAKSITRAKESGIRKTLGARKPSLFFQFLLEAIVMALFALFLAILVSPYLFKILRNFIGFDFQLDPSRYPALILPFFLITLIIGLMAGSYPALVMSNFNPVSVLKGNFKSSITGLGLRKVLVTLQFTMSLALILGSLIISSQIQFIQNKDLGFNRKETVLLQMPGAELDRHYETLKNQLLSNPDVLAVSVGGGRMDGDNGNVPILPEGFEDPFPMAIDAVRHGFYAALDIPMAAGREFSKQFPSDSAEAVIINQSAARTFGWEDEEAIGKRIRVDDIREGYVIGVTKDYHFSSLHQPIVPLVTTYPRTRLRDIYLKVKIDQPAALISSLQQDWNTIVPDIPFDLIFLDDHLQGLYKADLKFAKLINLFAILAILIACLGIYGLISLIAQHRVKELGIRKVLGASMQSLILTLSKPFLWLMIIALLIAVPVTYSYMDQWLSNFAYRIDFQILHIVLAGLGIFLLIGATLFLQSFKYSRANPINALRNE